MKGIVALFRFLNDCSKFQNARFFNNILIITIIIYVFFLNHFHKVHKPWVVWGTEPVPFDPTTEICAHKTHICKSVGFYLIIYQY